MGSLKGDSWETKTSERNLASFSSRCFVAFPLFTAALNRMVHIKFCTFNCKQNIEGISCSTKFTLLKKISEKRWIFEGLSTLHRPFYDCNCCFLSRTNGKTSFQNEVHEVYWICRRYCIISFSCGTLKS